MTHLRDRFVAEYLVDFHPAAAAIRAGAKAKNADVTAAKWLALPSVQQAVAEGKEALQRRTRVTQDRVLEELVDIAFTNLDDLVTWDAEGNVRFIPSDELSRGAKRALKKLKVKRTRQVSGSRADPDVWETESIEVEFHDKLKALELAGRHIGMWPKAEQDVNVQVSIDVQQNVRKLLALGIDDLRRLARGMDIPMLEYPEETECPPNDWLRLSGN